MAAEVFGQGSDREQVVAFGRMPVARFGQSAAGDEAVQMHVPAQGLAPGVQYTGHAERSVQALGVSTEGIEGSPDALEQQRVDDLGMQLYPLVELMGQGEYQVIIRHRQERLLLVFTPHLLGPALAFGALAVAGRVGLRGRVNAGLSPLLWPP